MKSLLSIFILLITAAPVRGQAEIYSATAPSSIMVEVGPQGLIVHSRSVRHEVYAAIPEDIKVGQPFEQRLATITTVSDGPIDDQTSTIEVTVDALSGSSLHRITAFSDPGSEGTVASPYFITTQRGCCSPLTRRHVRNLETGKPLFTATGSDVAGLVALMTVPNHNPGLARWAASEGLPEAGNGDPTMLGYLRYGDGQAAIDTLELRMDVAKQPADLMIDLPECGALLWLAPGHDPAPGQPHRPAAGKCFEPPGFSYSTPLLIPEHRTGKVGGFELEISLHEVVYATIPITEDHLDLAHARLAPGVTLVTVGTATGAAPAPACRPRNPC